MCVEKCCLDINDAGAKLVFLPTFGTMRWENCVQLTFALKTQQWKLLNGLGQQTNRFKTRTKITQKNSGGIAIWWCNITDHCSGTSWWVIQARNIIPGGKERTLTQVDISKKSRRQHKLSIEEAQGKKYPKKNTKKNKVWWPLQFLCFCYKIN